MPVHNMGSPGHAYANTNGSFRKEIKNHVEQEVTRLSQVQRTADNVIPTSDNFHYDTKLLTDTNQYKFEVQYLKGGKMGHQTVAVVLVETNATSVIDFRTALTNALTNGNIYRVS